MRKLEKYPSVPRPTQRPIPPASGAPFKSVGANSSLPFTDTLTRVSPISSLSNRGELDLGYRLAEDLLRLSGQRNDSGGLVLGYLSSGGHLMFVGRFASSRSHLEDALASYDP